MSAILVRRINRYSVIREYVSKVNPALTTRDINEAFRFDTVAHARQVKWGLGLERQFAAKRLPEWLR